MKKPKIFDLSNFRGKGYFGNNSKNYLVFEASQKHILLDYDGGASYESILLWLSKEVSKEVIKPPRFNNNILSPKLEHIANKEKVKFNGSCLAQDRIRYTPKTIVNIHIVYEITKNNPISSYPALENCLSGAVKLTENSDIDKYKYSGYDIRFDRREQFSFGSGFGQNVITFGADMSSSVHANNRTKKILVLGKGFTQYHNLWRKIVFNQFY